MEASSTEADAQIAASGSLGVRFWTLIASTYIAFLGIGTVLPGMAPHVRHDLGGSDQTVGFVIGTFSVVALCSRFVSGPLADRKGRKAAFLTGLVSCSAAGLAYLLPIGIAGAYLGRGLQGFGEACLFTGAAAWAVETAGIHRSGRALGYVSTGIWGGISTGPLIGQLLGSFERAATMQVILAMVSFALLSRIKENFEPHPDAGRMQIPRSLITAGLTMGFVNVHYPVVAGFLVLHLAQHGGGGPLAYSAYAGMVVLLRFFLGGLPDRTKPAYTFYAGLILMAVGAGMLALTSSPLMSISGAAILGMGFSFPWASVASVALRRAKPHERGSTVSVLGAFYDAFVGTFSFAAGFVSGRFGYSASFWMALAGVVVAAVVGLRVFRIAPAEEA